MTRAALRLATVDSLEWVFNPALDSSGNNTAKRKERARGEKRRGQKAVGLYGSVKGFVCFQ